MPAFCKLYFEPLNMLYSNPSSEFVPLTLILIWWMIPFICTSLHLQNGTAQLFLALYVSFHSVLSAPLSNHKRVISLCCVVPWLPLSAICIVHRNSLLSLLISLATCSSCFSPSPAWLLPFVASLPLSLPCPISSICSFSCSILPNLVFLLLWTVSK